MGKGKTPPGSRAKTTRSHTTAIDAVEKLLKPLNRMAEVEKISLGVIKPKLRAGQRRIKVTRENDKVLTVKVRGTNSHQVLRVYTSDTEKTTEQILAFAKKKGWGIT